MKVCFWFLCGILAGARFSEEGARTGPASWLLTHKPGSSDTLCVDWEVVGHVDLEQHVALDVVVTETSLNVVLKEPEAVLLWNLDKRSVIGSICVPPDWTSVRAQPDKETDDVLLGIWNWGSPGTREQVWRISPSTGKVARANPLLLDDHQGPIASDGHSPGHLFVTRHGFTSVFTPLRKLRHAYEDRFDDVDSISSVAIDDKYSLVFTLDMAYDDTLSVFVVEDETLLLFAGVVPCAKDIAVLSATRKWLTLVHEDGTIVRSRMGDIFHQIALAMPTIVQDNLALEPKSWV